LHRLKHPWWHRPKPKGVPPFLNFQIHDADPTGNVYFTRRRVNEAFLEALLEEFHKNGPKILERAGQENPATFLKVLAQLVPRELSVEHSGSIIGKLSDEQLAAMISECDRQIAEQLAKRAAGENAKLIDTQASQRRSAAQQRLAGANSILRRRHINSLKLASTLGGGSPQSGPSSKAGASLGL